MKTDVDHLFDSLKIIRHFDTLLSLTEGKEGYVVGGVVRDALIGLPIKDVDLVFPEDPTTIAKTFAQKIGGSWFWLDESRLQSRVVLNSDPICPDYDFAPFRASSLGQDLLDRDFTINAMAAPLSCEKSADKLVDPLCGLADLQENVLRMVGNKSFADDPLRILKGIRHAATLDLCVEPHTLHQMKEDVTGLFRVSPERIRQETWKIFDGQHIVKRGIWLLSRSIVGNFLFGDKYTQCVDGLEKCLEIVSERLDQFVEMQSEVQGWLSEEFEQGLSRRTLIVWTILMAQVDQSLPVRLADEWLLSRKAKSAVKALSGLGESAVKEFIAAPLRERAFAWLAVQYHVDPKLLLLGFAVKGFEGKSLCERAAKWVPVVNSLGDCQPEPLVDGHWLRNELGLRDGPEMTRAQSLLRAAEISGQVDCRESACDYLRRHYANMD